jgi:hypothetical protein
MYPQDIGGLNNIKELQQEFRAYHHVDAVHNKLRKSRQNDTQYVQFDFKLTVSDTSNIQTAINELRTLIGLRIDSLNVDSWIINQGTGGIFSIGIGGLNPDPTKFESLTQ